MLDTFDFLVSVETLDSAGKPVGDVWTIETSIRCAHSTEAYAIACAMFPPILGTHGETTDHRLDICPMRTQAQMDAMLLDILESGF